MRDVHFLLSATADGAPLQLRNCWARELGQAEMAVVEEEQFDESTKDSHRRVMGLLAGRGVKACGSELTKFVEDHLSIRFVANAGTNAVGFKEGTEAGKTTAVQKGGHSLS